MGVFRWYGNTGDGHQACLSRFRLEGARSLRYAVNARSSYSGQRAFDALPSVLGHAAWHKKNVVVLHREIGSLRSQNPFQVHGDLLASLRRGTDELDRSLGGGAI